jgi:hypothetical protein
MAAETADNTQEDQRYQPEQQQPKQALFHLQEEHKTDSKKISVITSWAEIIKCSYEMDQTRKQRPDNARQQLPV